MSLPLLWPQTQSCTVSIIVNAMVDLIWIFEDKILKIKHSVMVYVVSHAFPRWNNLDKHCYWTEVDQKNATESRDITSNDLSNRRWNVSGWIQQRETHCYFTERCFRQIAMWEVIVLLTEMNWEKENENIKKKWKNIWL